MTPLTKAPGPVQPIKPRDCIERARLFGGTAADGKREYKRLQLLEWYGNEKYSVSVDRDSDLHGFSSNWRCVHLSIHRRDRAPCDDWREFQQIKNDILGKECEAVQLYPAHARVMDTANEYHLWAFFRRDTDMPIQWPVGWAVGKRSNDSAGGAVQRPGA